MKYLTIFLTNLAIVVFLTLSGACKRQIEFRTTEEIPSPPVKGDFLFNPDLSDEFEDNVLDTLKWFPNNPGWEGRQPAFFSKENVVQQKGMLNLVMRLEEPSTILKEKGFHSFSTAAVRSKHTVKYGYFEIKSRAMKSKASSGFWFYNDLPGLWTEIDVFEICGTGERENQYNMALHVFRTPLINEHWSKGGEWRAPYRFADDFHVFGLEWTPFLIRWYVDGVAVRTVENTHWHQPLTMNFDAETQPSWFGLPDENELPSTFSIEYVRSWQYKTADWRDEGLWINTR